jgi:GDP-4-dehydro-6-deoxy-D-mannose reductase
LAGNLENRVLITGCEGFVGSYLAELLVGMGLNVYGMVYQDTRYLDHLGDRISLHHCDIANNEKVTAVLAEVKPHYVFHLAAQSLLTDSWHYPEQTFTINVLGTVYLLEGIRSMGLDPVIEIACSSDEYAYRQGESPIQESAEIGPSSPYGVSKLAADMLGHVYWQNYGMKVIRIRPFSIIGSRKVSDACSDFARGIVDIESGKKGRLNVGNLDTIRDFVDVRDAVNAMWLLAEQGNPGEVYNICSGRGVRMKDILSMLVSMSSAEIDIQPEPERMRASDKPVLVGDCSRLRELGWKPRVPLEKTLSDILDFWRANENTG